MADEAIIVELLGNKGDPIRYKVADGLSIAKGSVLEMKSGAIREVIQSTEAGRPIAGIAAHEKVASDGMVSMSVYTNLIVILKCNTTQLEVGDDVSPDAVDNNVKLHTSLDREKGFAFGKALETVATGSSGMVRVLI